MGLFDKVRLFRPKLNKFDLNHERKLSFNFGSLTPILVQDIVPGDRFRVKSEIFLRVMPMLAPIMHRVNVFTHYFFVPNRLIWDEFEDFITGGKDGTLEPVLPYFEANETTGSTVKSYLQQIGGLTDHMGLPTLEDGVTISNPLRFSALPFRAYQLIYNEYYRDQTLQNEIGFSRASGNMNLVSGEAAACLTQRLRCWEKDYFTSALPWAQRGPEVLMPLEGVASNVNGDIDWSTQATTTVLPGSTQPLSALATGNIIAGGAGGTGIENIDEIRVQNAASSINDLRRSIKLQEWLEKNARGGARYVEQILSHFGVVSSDARLQRPEYLGGGKNPIVISEVLSTFQDPTGEGVPQGNMSGHGVSVGNTNGFNRRFEEHGYVIGIISVLPKTNYQEGVPRHFTRFDKFDFPWPSFGNLGEQEIKNKEIYWDPTGLSGSGDDTWGYQSRYAELKYGCSSVHGLMRTDLSFWHMGRIFGGLPPLTGGFVESDVTDRIFPVQDGSDKLIAMVYNNVDALRPFPYYGTPAI